MLTLLIGAAGGWLITGTCDYFATRRATRRAYEAGVVEGQQNALRQVAGW